VETAPNHDCRSWLVLSRPAGVGSQNTRCHCPFLGHGVGPVAMQPAEVEFLLCGEMSHTGDDRRLERPVLSSLGKCPVDVGVMNFRRAIGTFRDWQALPRHPHIQHPQNEVEEAMLAQFALRPALGHREVREDTCGELEFRQVHRDGRGVRIVGRCAHPRRASREAG
jgi:hypothetical protein